MSGRLIVAALVRNEAKKYWRSALDAWSQFADKIVVVDDGSTDKTLEIAEKREKVSARQRYGALAWGAESFARRDLWDAAMEESARGDYIIWLDADMVPLADPRPLLRTDVDTYYFALYDLWGKDAQGRLLYRDDSLWSGHHRPRAWAIRRPGADFTAEWGDRGLHCGHLPASYRPRRTIFAPPSHSLLHYGYFDESDRLSKAAAYLGRSEQLTEGEITHARSITDASPHLKPLFERVTWELRK